jgi:hypothetical protein
VIELRQFVLSVVEREFQYISHMLSPAAGLNSTESIPPTQAPYGFMVPPALSLSPYDQIEDMRNYTDDKSSTFSLPGASRANAVLYCLSQASKEV